LSIEHELQRLALNREVGFESALGELDLEPPEFLLRQMRAYLADQEDHGRIKHFEPRFQHLHEEAASGLADHPV
jgi:hypothetical protein